MNTYTKDCYTIYCTVPVNLHRSRYQASVRGVSSVTVWGIDAAALRICELEKAGFPVRCVYNGYGDRVSTDTIKANH